MKRRDHAFAWTCAAALLLSACASDQTPRPWKPGASSEEPKPISVQVLKLEHPVRFVGASVAPAPGELAALQTFLEQSDARAGDVAIIDAPDGPLAEPRTAAILARLTDRRLRARVGHAAQMQSGTVTVILERYIASVPRCPDWSMSEWANFPNRTSSDFGCATALDLAAMVADPRDLAVGRTVGPQVGDPASRAVRSYRDGSANPGATSPLQNLLQAAAALGGGSGGGGSSGP